MYPDIENDGIDRLRRVEESKSQSLGGVDSGSVDKEKHTPEPRGKNVSGS